jgi:hypothetical protein
LIQPLAEPYGIVHWTVSLHCGHWYVLTAEVFGDVEQPTTVHPARVKTAIKTQAFDMGFGS